MPKKITTESFVAEAQAKHGNKYDYSKVKYIDARTKVCIVCPEHGEFLQNPSGHLSGKGCPKCAIDESKGIVRGWGINDLYGDSTSKCYFYWDAMLMRCYDKRKRDKFKCYEDVGICEEWRYLSNFKKWFDENHIEGFVIDKDLLSGDDKIYSPKTCCFIPQYLNILLSGGQRNTSLPVGVYLLKSGNYEARLSIRNKRRVLGTFEDKWDAFGAYKKAKEEAIRRESQNLYDQGLIGRLVYDALMRYEVKPFV